MLPFVAPMMIGQSQAPTTWSPTDKPGDWNLSADLLTATKSGASNTTGRATNYRSSGKVYAEIKRVGGSNTILLGIANALAPLNTPLGEDPDGHGIAYGSGGAITYKATSTTRPSYAIGSVLGIAVDLSARTIAWYVNGSLITTSSAIPAGPLTLAYGTRLGSGGNQVVTLNTGASPFVYTPPAGFSAWG